MARIRPGRRAAGLVGAAAVAAGTMLAVQPAAQSAPSGLVITDVVINKDAYPGVGLRHSLRCQVEVEFTDATPLTQASNSVYRVLVDGKGRGWLNPGNGPDSFELSCLLFSDGVPSSIVVQEYDWSSPVEESAPFEWTFHQLGHPDGGAMSNRLVGKHKVPVVTAGEKVTVSFDGEWDPEAAVTAKAMVSKGWQQIGKQGKNAKSLAVEANSNGTSFSFVVPKNVVGQSLYFSVKGTDGEKRSQVTDYGFSWEASLVVRPNAKKTKSSLIRAMGKKTPVSGSLIATKPALTKAGKKAGVKFVYSLSAGKPPRRGNSYHHPRTTYRGVECVDYHQSLRILAFVPGKLPFVKELTDKPNCGRRQQRTEQVVPEGPAMGHGSATGLLGPRG